MTMDLSREWVDILNQEEDLIAMMMTLIWIMASKDLELVVEEDLEEAAECPVTEEAEEG